MATSEQYQAHLNSLAEALHCELRQGIDTPGRMYVEFGYVEGPTLDSLHGPQVSYFVNLHELGHFALGHTQGRPPANDQVEYFRNGVLRSEAQAWEWALDKAIDEPHSITRAYMWDTCLGSYYRDAVHRHGRPGRLYNGNRHWVEFVYDKPDDYFQSVRQRIMCGDS